MRSKSVLLVLLLALIAFGAGCISSNHGSPPTHSPPSVGWKPDGVIEKGEYAYNASSGGFGLYLRVDNGTLFVGMKAPTRGWLAVGFGGGPGMKRTDIVIAYVLPNGTVEIRDDYSTGFAGPHSPDGLYGGRDDVIAYAGREDDNGTVVEFSRRINTGDPYDFPVPVNGTFRVIWAYGRFDDFNSDHVKAGHFYVNLGGGK